MSNHLKYIELREKFSEFLYEGYDISEEEDLLTIVYHFSVPDLASFHPTWKIPKKKVHGVTSSYLENLKEEVRENATLRKLIFSLGMVELISYWKIACPKKVKVHLPFGDELVSEELGWWKEQYFHGLGEFFYTNNIPLDPNGFMEMEIEGDMIPVSGIKTDRLAKDHKDVFAFTGEEKKEGGILIPIGGGKDSVVTLELLADKKADNVCFMINGRGATLDTAEVAGYEKEKILIVKRSLDEKMLILNKEGYLNGHTPFSAIVAFSTILVSYLYGIPFVALSNEGSANESTVEGSTVNHQYSKSFKFEADFTRYEKTYIGSGVHYFSLLRGWTELRIAREFAKHKAYHKIFRSCNVGSKENKWCAHCPKCLFVSLILGPFLSTAELVKIFGRNIAEDDSMLEDMKKLVGEVPEKPFECVGSREEVNVAICETIKRMEKEGERLPKLFTEYRETQSYRKYRDLDMEELMNFSSENQIPEFLISRVR